jgi:hypothetical protein
VVIKEKKMMKSALIIKNRLGLIIFSVSVVSSIIFMCTKDNISFAEAKKSSIDKLKQQVQKEEAFKKRWQETTNIVQQIYKKFSTAGLQFSKKPKEWGVSWISLYIVKSNNDDIEITVSLQNRKNELWALAFYPRSEEPVDVSNGLITDEKLIVLNENKIEDLIRRNIVKSFGFKENTSFQDVVEYQRKGINAVVSKRKMFEARSLQFQDIAIEIFKEIEKEGVKLIVLPHSGLYKPMKPMMGGKVYRDISTFEISNSCGKFDIEKTELYFTIKENRPILIVLTCGQGKKRCGIDRCLVSRRGIDYFEFEHTDSSWLVNNKNNLKENIIKAMEDELKK